MMSSHESYDTDAGTLFTQVDAHRNWFDARRQAYQDAAAIKGNTVEESGNRNFAGGLLIVRSPKQDHPFPLGSFASGNPMIKSGSVSRRAYDTGVFLGDDNVDCAERKLLEVSGHGHLEGDPFSQKKDEVIKGESEIELSYRSLVDELTSVIVLVSDNTPCSVCEGRIEKFVKRLLRFCSVVEVHIYATTFYRPDSSKQNLKSAWKSKYRDISLGTGTKLFHKITVVNEGLTRLQNEIQDNRNIRIDNTKRILGELRRVFALIEKNMADYLSKITTTESEITIIMKNLGTLKEKLLDQSRKIKEIKGLMDEKNPTHKKTNNKDFNSLFFDINGVRDVHKDTTDPESKLAGLSKKIDEIKNTVKLTKISIDEERKNIESVSNYVVLAQNKIDKDGYFYYENMEKFQDDVNEFKKNLKSAWTSHKVLLDKTSKNLQYLKESLENYRYYIFESNPEGISSYVNSAIKSVENIEKRFNDFQKKESEKRAAELDKISQKSSLAATRDKNTKVSYLSKIVNLKYVLVAFAVIFFAYFYYKTSGKTR